MSRLALPAASNVCLRSEEFSNAAWSKGTGITVTDNTSDILDPLGGNTASKVVYDGTGTAGNFYIAQGFGNGLVPGLSLLHLGIALSSGLWVYCTSSITVQITENGSGIFVAVAVPANTWTFVATEGKLTISSASSHTLSLFRNVGDNTARTIYLWGGQASRANKLGLYVKTTSAAVGVTPALRNAAIFDQNLCLQSETIDAAIWSKHDLTITANSIANPLDGAVTVDTLVDNGNNATHFLSQSINCTPLLFYTWSGYFKSANLARTPVVLLAVGTALGGGGTYFDLSDASKLDALSANEFSTIESLGNGWYRCSVTARAHAGATTASIQIYASPTKGTLVYTGDSTSALHIYGVQMVQANTPGRYVATVASQVNTGGIKNAALSRSSYSRRITALSQVSGLVADHDANLGITQSGGVVSNWADQSGSANTLTASGSAQPTFNASDLNGLPTLTFDGVDDKMTYGTLVSHGHLFLVMKVLTAGVTKCFFAMGGATDGFSLGMITGSFFATNFSSSSSTGFGTGNAGSADTTTWHIFSLDGNAFKRAVNGQILRRDGVDVGSQTDGSGGFTPQGNVLGYNGGGGTAFSNFKIARAAIYNRPLGNGERAKIEAFLSDKYGLPITTLQ